MLRVRVLKKLYLKFIFYIIFLFVPYFILESFYRIYLGKITTEE